MNSFPARLIVSVLVALLVTTVVISPFQGAIITVNGLGYVARIAFVPAILTAALGVGINEWLLRWHFRCHPSIIERFTRCRKCKYILNGLTEPRCPECGERI